MSTSLANHVLFTDSAVSLNVSIATYQNASSNDLYLTLSLPESYGWGSVGIGSGMSDALMFIIYPSADGQNTTLSTRTASGHVMPTSTDDYDCREITDSVVNENMEASFVCYGLADSSRLSVTNTETNWIYAVGPRRQVNSDSEDATIMRHASHGSFNVDMTITQNAAVDTSSTNSTATASSTTTPTSPASTSTTAPAVSIISATSSTTPPSNYDSLVTTHAVLLAGSFLVLFPLGVVLLYLTSVRIHYMWQVSTSILCFIGMIIALVMSKRGGDDVNRVNQGHQIMGLLTVCTLVVQVALGTAHHLQWKVRRSQTWKSVAHVALGRVVVVLGLITAILGFQLAGSTTGAVAYGIVAAVIVVLLGVFIFWRKKAVKREVAATMAGSYGGGGRGAGNVQMADL